ncbi:MULTISPECIES: hypothetical protein [Chryseobacterium]|uniref:Uncharacterized protein n=1 Tax=Candidatus Chryseobacterium massiliense TaxID=204089 RepID=A0A3D9BEG4_9FLAO|nr:MULTISPECIES: hypothetical protein [Chryseobacterium]REC51934.1 hypothetical protein DRF68_05020 [Candidatus Chryseobacterium massiliae]
MKKSIVKIMLFAAVIAVVSSFSAIKGDSEKKYSPSKNISQTETYQIRFGLQNQNGSKTLSGSYDLGNFVATNTVTGETFETYGGSGMQSLPQYFDGLPEGNYTFTATQGQGGWVGYGSVTAEVSEAKVDADGYVTIYVPIAWEE